MADNRINTPALSLGVSTRTRREAFTALGVTGLAAIAVGGFARPDNLIAGDQMSPAGDVALLAAIARFDQAHAEQIRFNASMIEDEDWSDAVAAEWYGGLEDVLDAPDPATSTGRVALARVAHTVLLDHAAQLVGVPLEEQATREERLAIRALASVAGAGS